MVQGKKQLNSKPKFAEVVIGDNEAKEIVLFSYSSASSFIASFNVLNSTLMFSSSFLHASLKSATGSSGSPFSGASFRRMFTLFSSIPCRVGMCSCCWVPSLLPHFSPAAYAFTMMRTSRWIAIGSSARLMSTPWV